jgi:phage terminase small subunit
MAKGLNERQLKWIDEFILTNSPRQASLNAGYSPTCADKQGNRFQKNPEMMALVEIKRSQLQLDTGITIENLVKEIYVIAQNSKHDEDRLKAYDMLMKHLGAYELDNKQKDVKILNVFQNSPLALDE